MTADYLCECTHPKARHQGGTYWCLTPDCDCKRYTPDFQTAEIVARAQAEPDQPALSAQLRRVEQERDAAVRKTADVMEQLWASERQCVAARAELASARTELNGLRAANDQLRADYSAAAEELERLRTTDRPAEGES